MICLEKVSETSDGFDFQGSGLKLLTDTGLTNRRALFNTDIMSCSDIRGECTYV